MSVQEPTVSVPEPIVVYFSRKNDVNSHELLSKFIESYLAHPAGWPHRLFFIKKGYKDFEEEWQKALAPLSHVDYGAMEVPDQNYCFGYQRILLERHPDRYFLFLSAHSRVLVDDWLERYMRHAAPNRILGGSGNYCSQSGFGKKNAFISFFTPSKWSLRSWMRYFMVGKGPENQFVPYPFFPNPHIRTSVFMAPPHILDVIDWPTVEMVPTKSTEYLFESGKFGLSVQAWKAGMELYAVGADGEKYPVQRWPESKIYCSGKQENLIIGENHTRIYEEASAGQKRRLHRICWGRHPRLDIEKMIACIPSLDAAPRCGVCQQRGRKVHAFTTKDYNRRITDDEFSYSLCLGCDTVSIDSVPENLSLYYSGNYGPYVGGEFESITRDTLGLMQKYLPDGGDYLEIGPGAGWTLRAMRKAGYRTACIEMDETCCARFASEGVEAFWSSDPAGTLRSTDRKWDAILAFHVFEHLRDPLDVLQACAGSLKPGGVLILAVPDLSSLACRMFPGEIHFLIEAPRHVSFLTERTYTEAAARFGMRTLECIRDDEQARLITEGAWTCFGESLIRRNAFVRFVYLLNCLQHFLRFHIRTNHERALDSTRRLLKMLERSMGKSAAFTLVFQKEES